MKIALGADHGGFELKETIKKALEADGHTIVDLGTHSTDSVDYPYYGAAVGRAVADGTVDRGIAVCGTGIGISIAANKIKGVRAALCTSLYMAELTRRHNDSNVLCLGGRVTDLELGVQIAKLWIETEFEGGRHQKRIDMIHELEK